MPEAHVPHEPHAELQQTPETQSPEEHASGAGQLAPFVSFATHVPPLHHAPGSQLPSVVHDDWQTPLAHTPGAQLVPEAGPCWHVPAPLHVSGVATLPTQTLPHDVPVG